MRWEPTTLSLSPIHHPALQSIAFRLSAALCFALLELDALEGKGRHPFILLHSNTNWQLRTD